MFNVVPISDFYYENVKDFGVRPADTAKVAEARRTDPEQAKLAQAIHDQMILDGVPSTSPQARVSDAFKIAYACMKIGAEPVSFYYDTMKFHGVETTPDAKIASAPIEVKIAAAFYDQTRLDGIAFKTDEDRRDFSLKLASTYAKHIEVVEQNRAKLASALHAEALTKVAEYLKSAGVTMSAEEALKIATEDALHPARALTYPSPTSGAPLPDPDTRVNAILGKPGPIAGMTEVSQLTQRAPHGATPVDDAAIRALHSDAPYAAKQPVVPTSGNPTSGNPTSGNPMGGIGSFISRNKLPLALGGAALGGLGLYAATRGSEG